MSIRATVTIECDSNDCQAELVLDATDVALVVKRSGVQAEFYASGWQMDDDDQLHCPECCEENPREKGDDDGVEYGHPRDRMEGRE